MKGPLPYATLADPCNTVGPSRLRELLGQHCSQAGLTALHREWLLVEELGRHGTHREEIGRLGRRHAADDHLMKAAIAALKGALLPDLLHVSGEKAVLAAVERDLGILAA